MGGLVLLALWGGAVFCLQPWWASAQRIGFVLTAGALFGAIGWLDDWLSIRRRHSTGLNVVQKLGLTSLASFLLFLLFGSMISGPLAIPFTSLTLTLPPIATFFLTWLVFVATANSLNLADGQFSYTGRSCAAGGEYEKKRHR